MKKIQYCQTVIKYKMEDINKQMEDTTRTLYSKVWELLNDVLDGELDGGHEDFEIDFSDYNNHSGLDTDELWDELWDLLIKKHGDDNPSVEKDFNIIDERLWNSWLDAVELLLDGEWYVVRKDYIAEFSRQPFQTYGLDYPEPDEAIDYRPPQ